MLNDTDYLRLSYPNKQPDSKKKCTCTCGFCYLSPCTHACVYDCIHACMYGCMHRCVYVRMYDAGTYECVKHVCEYNYAHICIYIHIIHTYIHTCIHTCIHTYIHTYKNIHTQTSYSCCGEYPCYDSSYCLL